jgi:hypothetical protein
MIITIIAPEMIFGKAIGDLASAIYNNKRMKEFIEKDDVDWGLSHSYFANMGGFIIHFPRNEGQASRTPSNTGIEASSDENLDPNTIAGEVGQNSSNTRRQSERVTPVEPIPSGATQEFRSGLWEKDKGLWSLKRFRDTNATRRAFLGDVAWTADGVNTALANEALKTVTWDQEYNSAVNYHDNLKGLQGNIWVLDAKQLLYARSQGIIAGLPMIAKEELDDRNKGDPVVKLLSLFQISWLILQLIVRKFRHLAVSQLEISTLAFAVSSFVTYVIFWKKPQEARFPTACTAIRHPTVQEISHLAGIGPNLYWSERDGWWIPEASFHYAGRRLKRMSDFLVGICFGNTIFSGLHVLAWNFLFPSTMERLFWRISTVSTMAIPWVFFLVNMAVFRMDLLAGFLPPKSKTIMLDLFMVILVPAYILARLFMMVEIFRTLYYLPPSAYRSTKSANISHLG